MGRQAPFYSHRTKGQIHKSQGPRLNLGWRTPRLRIEIDTPRTMQTQPFNESIRSGKDRMGILYPHMTCDGGAQIHGI